MQPCLITMNTKLRSTNLSVMPTLSPYVKEDL